jgi:hypothetical protein
MGGKKFEQKENEKKKLKRMQQQKKNHHTKNPLHKFCLSWALFLLFFL